MKLRYLILSRNVLDSHCDDNLDGLGGGYAPPEEPAHVATGPDIDTY